MLPCCSCSWESQPSLCCVSELWKCLGTEVRLIWLPQCKHTKFFCFVLSTVVVLNEYALHRQKSLIIWYLVGWCLGRIWNIQKVEHYWRKKVTRGDGLWGSVFSLLISASSVWICQPPFPATLLCHPCRDELYPSEITRQIELFPL